MDVKAVGSADINAVLAQMRMLREQAKLGSPDVSGVDTAARADRSSLERLPADGVDFGATLKSALQSVNALQKTSSATANGFIEGSHDDLVKVMVDGQKANLGFQAMVQVRNRMISAYQDIMNMPI